MKKRFDHTGKRYGRLVAIEACGKASNGTVLWRCKCDCGNEAIIRGPELTRGGTKSCGCLYKENIKSLHLKHGDTVKGGAYHKLYQVWGAIIQRCTNKNSEPYERYGGRGISIFPEWKQYEKFKEWAVSQGWEPGLEVDRIDVNGDYSPYNCRLTNDYFQNRNKRNNIFLDFFGKKIIAKDFARHFGVCYESFRKKTKEQGKEFAMQWAIKTCSKKLANVWDAVSGYGMFERAI